MNPQLSTAQDPSFCFSLPDKCQSYCFFWACFSEGKLNPTGCRCHQWPLVLPCHSIPSLLLSGMHFSHSFVLAFPFSPDHCALGSLGAVCVFGCSRSIHPLWWNRIQWPPLCPVVPIPGSCLLSVRDWELVRGDEVTQWLIRRKAKNARLLGITDRWYWIRVNRPKVISVYVNTLDRILRAIWCAVLFWLPWRKPYI